MARFQPGKGRRNGDTPVNLNLASNEKNRTSLLFPIGLLAVSASQAAIHLTSLPDVVTGTLTGTGIGLMLLALLRPARTAAG